MKTARICVKHLGGTGGPPWAGPYPEVLVVLLRIVTFAIAAVIWTSAYAAGDQPSGRYGIAPSDHGFVRLDTKTGDTSHCLRHDGVWRCDPIAETGSEVASKLDGLSEGLAALTGRVDDMAADLAAMKAAKAVAAEAAVDEATGFAHTVVNRFKTMVHGLKKNTGWSL